MKCLIVLEAENVCLQLLLNKETYKMNDKQAIDNAKPKRKPKILDKSDDDTLSNNSKLSEQKERSKCIKTIVNDRKVTIFLLVNISKLIFLLYIE